MSQPHQTKQTRQNPPKRSEPMTESKVRDVGSVVANMTEVPEVKQEELSKWLEELYSVTSYTDEDIKLWWDAFSYKGFNRNDVLKQLKVIAPDPRLATELVILCALRGPQSASTVKLSSGRTPIQMGIPASGGQGTKTLTCNKITAATADLAAYYLKKMDAPKRLDMPCPGWLQFPSAGSIKLPEQLRQQHLEFATAFSPVIGGLFQPQIYTQMKLNAYLDEKLQLFS
jgi:hypothetical protein